MPVIVAGDFNDVWGNLGRRVMEPAGFESAARPSATFPAARPLRCLDRVFVRGAVHLKRVYRAHLALAREASDHLPVVATMTFA